MYLDRFRVDGRVAVVTGGAQGIGFASAQALGEAGAKVILADLDPARTAEAVERLRALGVDAAAETLDVRDSKAADDLAERVRTAHGPARILVNSAGFVKSEVPAEDTSDAHWRMHMDVLLDGTFWCCRAFGKLMLEQGRGEIVNIGSMAGEIVVRPQAQCFYNAAKAAVHQLTRSLATEWATRGVRVNAVAPTYIATSLTLFAREKPEMFATWLENTPMGRLGEPDEIAATVLFLASDAASLLTGSIVLADGGYTSW
jgi:NAD(P)-dependent dehydrogenase (short-subunit alcohol dehydrogenase family)